MHQLKLPIKSSNDVLVHLVIVCGPSRTLTNVLSDTSFGFLNLVILALNYAILSNFNYYLLSFANLCDSQGVRLELCAPDRPGLLADVTRTFRENGLNVTRTEISTNMDTALNVFYVTDAMGNKVDPKIMESVRQKIGLSNLKVKELPLIYNQKGEERKNDDEPTTVLLSLGSLVRRNLYNLGLIRSYS